MLEEYYFMTESMAVSNSFGAGELFALFDQGDVLRDKDAKIKECRAL